MLPDFPKLKRRIHRAITRQMRAQIRQDPLLSRVRHKRHFEGNRWEAITEDGKRRETEYVRSSAPQTVNRADVLQKGIGAFLETVSPIAEEMQKQAVELMAKTLERVTAETGNVVDAGGKPITFDHYMEMYEKVWVDFDDAGNPYPHTLVAGPEVITKLQESMKEWESDPEKASRFHKLIERKREEWRDRESHRKLVD